jgi:methylglyoxal synthase
LSPSGVDRAVTRLALVAHDDEKPEMIDFVRSYEDTLTEFELVGTGTTGQRITEETDLSVECKESGPYGGDLELGAEVATGELDAVIFLRDPLTAQPHEPDISALLRICDVNNVPLATTRQSAEYVLAGVADDE